MERRRRSDAKGDRVVGPFLHHGAYRLRTLFSDGRRTYKSFPGKTKADVEAIRDAANRKLAVKQGVTVARAIEDYAHDRATNPKRKRPAKASSITTTTYNLTAMFRGREDVPIGMLTPEDAQELYDTMAKTYAADTHRNALGETKTFMRWCMSKERKLIKANVFEGVQGVGERVHGQDKPQLGFDDAARFRSTALEKARGGDEGAIATLIALMMNLRASEITRRRVHDIDKQGTVLWVNRKAKEGKTKASRRTLEIPRVLQGLLARQTVGRAPMDFIFGDGVKPRDRNWVRKSSHRLCRSAGVPEVDAHGLRRTHATLATEVNSTAVAVDRALEDAARGMGHADRGATAQRSYVARGTIERLRAAKVTDVLDELDDERHPPQRTASEPVDNFLGESQTKKA